MKLIGVVTILVEGESGPFFYKIPDGLYTTTNVFLVHWFGEHDFYIMDSKGCEILKTAFVPDYDFFAGWKRS